MPAAAVIPAPIAYIKVVVVKKLVVGSQSALVGASFGRYCRVRHLPSSCRSALRRVLLAGWLFTLKKLECSKQAFA